MKLTVYDNPASDAFEFSGTIPRSDIGALHLDGLDRMLLGEPTKTAADFLLVAEMLFRRHAERIAALDAAKKEAKR